MKAKVRRKKNKVENGAAREMQGIGKASIRGKWVSFSEVAKLLGCARLTVRLRVKEGVIPGGVEFLGHLRLDRKTFENWLKSQPIGNN